MVNIKEGTIDFDGYKTWYRRVGESQPGKLPLLVLHGGPGIPHDYLESLDELAEHGREVIYYDQTGCGHSARPFDPDVFDLPLFESELAQVIAELKLDKVHILGQSWGGMLLLSYMIDRKPPEVKSIVASSAPVSMQLFAKEIRRLVELLPAEQIALIDKALKDKNYEDPDFVKASDMYYDRHVQNFAAMPEAVAKLVARSFEQVSPIYALMQGEVEFEVVGKLKNWDVTDRIHEISVPTLLISGISDEVTPISIKTEFDLIPNAKWHLLEGTHLVHAEHPDIYNPLVEEFLSEND